MDGPYNIRIDPAVGLPTARIVYPERGAVLRRDIDVIGIAGGRIGIEKVEVRLGDGRPERHRFRGLEHRRGKNILAPVPQDRKRGDRGDL